MNRAEEYITISLELRFVLFGLQAALNTNFKASEVEKVFQDAETDHVSEKNYIFSDSPSAKVTGIVEAYEPETIILRLEHKTAQELLKRITENARYEITRINQSTE